MAGRVENKVAFITGAARGQGRAAAVRLAEEGADIIAIDVDKQLPEVPYPTATAEDLAETVRLVEKLGRRVVADTCDVRDAAKLASVVAAGVAELGRLDIVLANAGVAILGPWHTVTSESMRATVDINLIGTWNTVMAALPPILAAGNGGSIILTSSANGLKAGPWTLAYSASKYALTGMAKSFAMELAKDRIRVNSVHPGAVDTPMAEFTSAPGGFIETGTAENPNLLGMCNSWLPGLMPAREIANAVLFLASDETAWITGHALAVDGGGTQY
ncbi:3-ketoacyl-ACP reductase [Frankia sp. R43]|uniref:mycofactocin-coupled SDR family oxidoreductase n=1 Tax=Frankia sp. R43 TaxID=269536 RepID=UPI0006CA3AC5|nr:mycofactocin-coupled SDR family oxidoreductase [Frankia sp. R43]KPM51930.1 3-ketoacyl-ACP reductase [Frankia sp. R43]